MKTELLIIRNKKKYIRIIDGSFQLCGLDKASVFPVKNIEEVRKYLEKMKNSGFEELFIKKLIITEEDI